MKKILFIAVLAFVSASCIEKSPEQIRRAEDLSELANSIPVGYADEIGFFGESDSIFHYPYNGGYYPILTNGSGTPTDIQIVELGVALTDKTETEGNFTVLYRSQKFTAIGKNADGSDICYKGVRKYQLPISK